MYGWFVTVNYQQIRELIVFSLQKKEFRKVLRIGKELKQCNFIEYLL